MWNQAYWHIRSKIRYQIFNWRIVRQNEPKSPHFDFYSNRIWWTKAADGDARIESRAAYPIF